MGLGGKAAGGRLLATKGAGLAAVDVFGVFGRDGGRVVGDFSPDGVFSLLGVALLGEIGLHLGGSGACDRVSSVMV